MNRQKSDIDRGWAWVVLVAAYLGMFIFCLAMYMNGVLYVALLERFREGEAKTALIGAIGIGLQCFTRKQITIHKIILECCKTSHIPFLSRGV